MPGCLRLAAQTQPGKAKTPASFLTGVHVQERPARGGNSNSCLGPEQQCTGLSVVHVVDSRTWHARSFPVKNWLIKLMRCDSATSKFVRQTIRACMTCVVVFMLNMVADIGRQPCLRVAHLAEVIAAIGAVKSSPTSDSIS
jgi:hypothetical protein